MKVKGEVRDNFYMSRTSVLVGIKAREGTGEGTGYGGRQRRNESMNTFSVVVITVI